jgi:SWI/SNF-related matrix-associated actin-dependent regulator of chromatin subfamily A member 5
VPEEFTDKDH